MTVDLYRVSGRDPNQDTTTWHISDTIRPAETRPGLRARLWRRIEAVAERQAHTVEIRALQAKSDAELARIGLTRADIAQHVLRGYYYV